MRQRVLKGRQMVVPRSDRIGKRRALIACDAMPPETVEATFMGLRREGIGGHGSPERLGRYPTYPNNDFSTW